MSAVGLAPRLASARLRDPRGGAWPDALAVAAFAVCTWLALTVAGGTWMFVTRARAGVLDGATGVEAEILLQTYVLLAALACGLLVVPVLTLGGAAARLSASSRAKRLASLRLVGVTGAEVVGMSVVEALVQAAAGVVVGTVVWAVSLPAWTLVSFQRHRIGLAEMLPPWWLGLGVVAVVLVLAALSTAAGLRTVRITPLGVAHRHTPQALRWLRGLVTVVAVVGFGLFGIVVRAAPDVTSGVLAMAMMMAVVIGALNLFGPWVLQLVAFVLSRTGDPARLLAFRRVLDDPRSSWRSIGSLSLLSLVAGFVCLAPDRLPGATPTDEMLLADIRTGVLVTLGVGLVLAATSTAITQAAAVFDRRDQLMALDRMGVSAGVLAAARRWEVLVPLVLTSGAWGALGMFLAQPLRLGAPLSLGWSGLALLAGTVMVGVALAAGAAELGRPLTKVALGQVGRRAD